MTSSPPCMPESLPLARVSLLVTRPALPGARLCRRLSALGVRCTHIPLLATEAQTPPAQVLATLASTTVDAVVFISVAAVEHGLPCLREQAPHLLAAPLIAVGASTAAALAAQSLHGEQPDNADSDGLLAMALLQHPRHVLIVRGVGGRELLADTLRARAAQVDYLEVYRRILPATSRADIATLLTTAVPALTLISSAEALRHWQDCAGTDWTRTQLLVVSQRLADLAHSAGAQHLLVAKGATDADIEAALRTLVTPPTP